MFLRSQPAVFLTAGAQRMDLDHTKAYMPPARGGPPGQTGIHNLGPIVGFEHRVKTHGWWRVRQPAPGVWIWRSPNRAYYLVTSAGNPQPRKRVFRPPNLAGSVTDHRSPCFDGRRLTVMLLTRGRGEA